jgi:hypothetical protein
MRIWSIHPQYLDTKGLVALWREALLAKNVLQGKTKGYKNHPQLNRFKNAENAVDCINQYLSDVYDEAVKRRYHFNKNKIEWDFRSNGLTVTTGQVKYETAHLLQKLKSRDVSKYNDLIIQKELLTHPMFHVIDGEIEGWEKFSEERKYRKQNQ